MKKHKHKEYIRKDDIKFLLKVKVVGIGLLMLGLIFFIFALEDIFYLDSFLLEEDPTLEVCKFNHWTSNYVVPLIFLAGAILGVVTHSAPINKCCYKTNNT